MGHGTCSNGQPNQAAPRPLRTGIERAGAPRAPGPCPHVEYECLSWRIPRALHARGSIQSQWPPEQAFPGYVAQEKLDGVFTLWTGQRLVTKVGHPVPLPSAFAALLPPFPFVAELYLGNHTLALATQLVTHPETQAALWAEARLVAFDVPGCEPPEQWPYSARYALLRHVIAAWSDQVLRGPWGKAGCERLPLQLIACYPMKRLAALFQAVVHGHHWEQRQRERLPSFGIPTARTVTQHGVTLRVAVEEGWVAGGCPFEDAQRAASGEGCMLWQQDAPWSPRGTAGRGTTAVLKYKPTLLIAATVLDRPYHSHRTPWQRWGDAAPSSGESDGRLPGYHVRVTWEAAFDRTPRSFVAWLPPGGSESDVVASHPRGMRTFVAFVSYSQRPAHCRALGRTLTLT